ncbi:acyl-CoA dehydrogenase family protein [Rhodococcus sp. T2V]|uniref:acyl-CoA dehydrogenase family protein n=1 Tax=Rhodococcus sp. T2V TaxID=3034164 RepID=UPI0023E18A0E|nr:acyl-CoA dehydrogenase family protein [Rhodococcus sp. T2V]MDF3305287.1 acyl-CoA dehydrogenase family protein [Rhodococcus sp. T2V]
MDRGVFGDEHEQFRIMIRKFFTDEVLPDYPNWQEHGMPPRWFWKRAGELGILGIGVPTEYGGLPDSDLRYSAVVTEEAQRLGFALGGLRIHTDIAMPYFLEYANAEQRARWLPGLVSGDSVVALGISEPGAGSDLKAMSTRASRDGDAYVIDGSKTFISNGGGADLIVLACKTDPSAGRNGISLIVVETDTPGFKRGRRLNKLGLHAQDLAELSFTDMRVPIENLLGNENDGFSMLTFNLAQERLSIALNSQASARATIDATVAALAGTSPDQRAKFALAACRAETAAGQALMDSSLEALIAGRLDPLDAAIAKLYATELHGRVVDRCTRVLGLSHYNADDIVGQFYLDGRVSRIYGGSSEIMKVIIAQGFDFRKAESA